VGLQTALIRVDQTRIAPRTTTKNGPRVAELDQHLARRRLFAPTVGRDPVDLRLGAGYPPTAFRSLNAR